MKIKEIKFVDDDGRVCRIVPHCQVNIQMVIDPVYCHIKKADGSEQIININEPYFTLFEPFTKCDECEEAVFTKYIEEGSE